MTPYPTKPVKLKPHVFNVEMRGRIRTTLQTGVPWRCAAVAAGVSADVFGKWRKRGGDIRKVIDATGDYPEDMASIDYGYLWLWDLLEELNAKVVVRLVGRVNKSAKSDWHAAAWLLERKAPADFVKSPLTVAASSKPGEGGNVSVTIQLPDNGRSLITP